MPKRKFAPGKKIARGTPKPSVTKISGLKPRQGTPKAKGRDAKPGAVRRPKTRASKPSVTKFTGKPLNSKRGR